MLVIKVSSQANLKNENEICDFCFMLYEHSGCTAWTMVNANESCIDSDPSYRTRYGIDQRRLPNLGDGFKGSDQC